MNRVKPARLLSKAGLLFLILNFLFGVARPSLATVSIYNLLVPGQLRFPYGRGLEHSNLTVDDLDVNFASHVITARPKAENEYRILILGDSSVWGDELSPRQAFSEQANSLGVSCQGKYLRFYNLAYPQSSILKDLLVLDRAMQYQPDMVILFETIDSFIVTEEDPFLGANQVRVESLYQRYGLEPVGGFRTAAPVQRFWGYSIVGQRRDIKRLVELQFYGLLRTGIGAEDAVHEPNRSLSNDLPASTHFRRYTDPVDLRDELDFHYLDHIMQISGDIPVIVVNEPIFIADGLNSDLRYNAYVPRWAYDQYQEIMLDYAREAAWQYVNLWDRIPQAEFTDSPLHLSEYGNLLLAEILMPAIREISCH
ncbi:MAG: SGNH/GDSL hydrolase family protein [Anaerolineales bacterium]|nr:SGNH/GDSL hydrolase family protein [Anaerolineales bacterium]